jgi:hypothetical protein
MPAEQAAKRQPVDEPGKTHDVDEPSQVLAQVPLPLQLPWPLRGVPAIVAQLPGVLPPVLSLQDWQVPLQAALQQTPSTQLPPMHWSLAVQVEPLPRFAVHVPLKQRPLTQSASAAQVDALHALAEAQTTPPVQALAAGVEQTPAPLHVPAVVSCPPLQAGEPQPTLAIANRQPPFPSQVPSWPQAVESSVQAPAEAPPAATGLHRPVAQVMHVPAQVVAQQMPAMQLACVHWSLAVQVDPSERVAAQIFAAVQ